jgi:hypothetical protein
MTATDTASAEHPVSYLDTIYYLTARGVFREGSWTPMAPEQVPAPVAHRYARLFA